MRPPNIVVCLCDQLRSFSVGCYGDAHARTPNIDRLAVGGVRFEQAFSNNPVCTPSRSSLLSGQYGRTCTGEIGNVADDPPTPVRRRLVDPTLPEALRGAGYQTALIGKWHIDPSPMSVGFDYSLHPLTIHRYAQQTFLENDKRWFDVGPYAPDFEGQQVRRYIGENRDRPFFLFYNISLPHEPIGAAEMPPQYAGMFDPAQVPLRPNVYKDGQAAHREQWFKIYTIWDYFWRVAPRPCWNASPRCNYPGQIGELPTDALPAGFDLRHLTALYYGATAWTDALVGGLRASLEENGLLDNTIVVFLSDHGDNLGSHHLFNKDCLYEESIRIPMIFHWPQGLSPRVDATHLSQIIDVAPTLLGLAGVDAPPTMQGRNLAAAMRGDAQAPTADHVFIETEPYVAGRPTIGIRTSTHLYGMKLTPDCRRIEDERYCLYDLTTDPYQERNIITSAGDSPLAQRLRGLLRQWHEQTPWLTAGEQKK